MAQEKKPKTENSTRRGVELHKKNPFMVDSYAMVKSRTKRVTNNKGGMMVVGNTGEIVADIAGFWQGEEVDSSKFVKLYINGVKAFKELTAAGTKVFEFLYLEIQKNIGKDQVYLSWIKVQSEETEISRTTWFRGLNELITKKFVASTEMPNIYWINPDYLWNGDRLSFVKAYVKRDKPKTIIDDMTLQLDFGKKLDN